MIFLNKDVLEYMIWVYQIIIITEVIIHNPVFEESRYMTLIWRIKV